MRRSSVLVAVALLFSAGCSTSKTEATGPRLSVKAPATVEGNVVDLELTATGMSIVAADGDTTGKTGHYHIFIDREPVAAGEVIAREAGIVHSAVSPTKLTGLSVGRHRFVVVLGDGAHRRVGTAAAEATVDVKGPSVDASAPASVALGSPVVVNVTVTGVTLVKADGDTTGKTGHLHVFVDREPTPAGQAIPTGQADIIHSAATTISIPGLAKGEHTMWVVLGNGVHVPPAAPVLDKLTVTVT